MARGRRWLQFSLRGSLLAMTIACLWLGRTVDRAQKQRAAVEAIEAIGGVVQYDWQSEIASWERSPPASKYPGWGTHPGTRFAPTALTPSAPAWVRQLLGEDLFQEVNGVIFRTRNASYWQNPDTGLINVSSLPNKHATAGIDAVIPHLRNLPRLQAIYLQGKPDKISEATENMLRSECPQCSVIRE